MEQGGRIQDLTVWSQSDEMSFMNNKCKRMVYASAILDEEYNEKEFKQKEYIITPNQIGKESVYINIEKKDMAKRIVDRKVEERTHPQELDSHTHSHNGYDD